MTALDLENNLMQAIMNQVSPDILCIRNSFQFKICSY
jgi:hypothetical protein